MNRIAGCLLSVMFVFLCVCMFVSDNPVVIMRCGFSAVLIAFFNDYD